MSDDASGAGMMLRGIVADVAERCWIIYDSRAATGCTDEAAVLQTCESHEEAKREVRETWPSGQIFVVDIVDGFAANERGPLEGSALLRGEG